MSSSYDGRIASFMEQLVDAATQRVRFRSLHETHAFLTRHGFRLSWKEEYGPKGGWQLYYHGQAFRGGGQGMIVRIKTHGEHAGRPRAFRPHLSVTWQEGISNLGREQDDFKDHEKAKFDPQGREQPKSPPAGSPADKDRWADQTHPLFPGFESSSASNPKGLAGAETLHESGAAA